MISQEQIEKINKFEQIMKRGHYCSGQEVTDVHNAVFGKNLRSTNCSSCISQRIRELIVARNEYIKAQEAVNNATPTTTKEDANKSIVGQTPEQNKPIKKVGRPSKK